MRTFVQISFAVAAIALIATVPAAAQDDQTVLVVLDSEADADQVSAEIAEVGADVVGKQVIGEEVIFTVRTDSPGKLEQIDGVASVDDNGEVTVVPMESPENGTGTTLGPAETGQDVPWGVKKIDALEAATQVDEEDVDVAVIDTGVSYTHPDLRGTVEWGVNTVGSEVEYGKEAADDNHIYGGHGTHVAGTIAALDNERGVVGVSPGVDIYAVKSLNQYGSGQYSDLIRGIELALRGPDGELGTADDADVISLSVTGGINTPSLQRAVQEASEHAVVVAAAGNSGDDDPTTNEVAYPAKYDSTIAVAGTTDRDTPMWMSSEGDEVTVAAPGVAIRSTGNSGGYRKMSGTSMSVPHVSGSTALLIGKHGEITTDVAAEALSMTAKDVAAEGEDNYVGAGRIRADALVSPDRSTAPIVDVMTPANGTTADRVTVTANAIDLDGQLAGLQLKVGNTSYQMEYYGGAEYRRTIDLTETVDGETATITVRAIDTDENVDAERVTVAVEDERESANISVEGVETRRYVPLYDNFSVYVMVENNGGETGRAPVYLTYGNDERVKEVELAAESRKTVEFTIRAEDEMAHNVSRDGGNTDRPIVGVTTLRINQDTTRNVTILHPLESPVGQSQRLPTDPDSDGLYEDVNGNGEVTIQDVQVLWNARNETQVTENWRAFDYNQDGQFDTADVTVLFDSIVEDD